MHLYSWKIYSISMMLQTDCFCFSTLKFCYSMILFVCCSWEENIVVLIFLPQDRVFCSLSDFKMYILYHTCLLFSILFLFLVVGFRELLTWISKFIISSDLENFWASKYIGYSTEDGQLTPTACSYPYVDTLLEYISSFLFFGL